MSPSIIRVVVDVGTSSLATRRVALKPKKKFKLQETENLKNGKLTKAQHALAYFVLDLDYAEQNYGAINKPVIIGHY